MALAAEDMSYFPVENKTVGKVGRERGRVFFVASINLALSCLSQETQLVSHSSYLRRPGSASFLYMWQLLFSKMLWLCVVMYDLNQPCTTDVKQGYLAVLCALKKYLIYHAWMFINAL